MKKRLMLLFCVFTVVLFAGCDAGVLSDTGVPTELVGTWTLDTQVDKETYTSYTTTTTQTGTIRITEDGAFSLTQTGDYVSVPNTATANSGTRKTVYEYSGTCFGKPQSESNWGYVSLVFSSQKTTKSGTGSLISPDYPGNPVTETHSDKYTDGFTYYVSQNKAYISNIGSFTRN